MLLGSIPILEKLMAQANQGNFAVIQNLDIYISRIVSLLLIVAGLASFGYLVLGGVSWITAGTDTNKVDEARTRLTNAIIGLAIVAASWAVFLIIDYFFGLGLVSDGGSSVGSGGNIPF
jgi:hypothetical protein